MQEDLQEDDENKRTIIQKETMRWWPNNEIPYKLRKVFSFNPTFESEFLWWITKIKF